MSVPRGREFMCDGCGRVFNGKQGYTKLHAHFEAREHEPLVPKPIGKTKGRNAR